MSYIGKVTIKDLYIALKAIVNLLTRPITSDPITGKTRVIISTDSSLSLTNITGFDAKQSLLYPIEKTSFNLTVRNRIS